MEYLPCFDLSAFIISALFGLCPIQEKKTTTLTEKIKHMSQLTPAYPVAHRSQLGPPQPLKKSVRFLNSMNEKLQDYSAGTKIKTT